MKNLIKTGVTISAVAVLSLVGFTAAFGYGGGGSSGGSGWIDPRCYVPVNPPAGGFKFRGMQGHDVYNRNVQFDIDGGDAEFMMISDKADFAGATIEPYSKSRAFELSNGYGAKMVYARFFNHCKIPTNIHSWDFNYRFRHVLGEQVYGEGTLLRGTDNKVYVVSNGKLVYIAGPSALRRYVGREILNVEDAVIESFNNGTATPAQAVLGAKVFANGTLIRGTNKKIYVIVNGKKVYIQSLQELAAKYLGHEIIDVTDEVLAQY